MNSLERAKRFVAQKASRLALAVVPLAAMAISAIPAKAGNIQLTTGANCFASPASGSCSTFEQGLVGGNTGLNWVAMGGSTSPFFSGGSIEFFASGGSSGEFLGAGSIPVSWDFFVNTPAIVTGQVGAVNWDVQFGLETSNGEISFSSGGSAFLDTEITGSGAITNPSGGTVSGYFISLSLDQATNGSLLDYSVSIPGNTSLDLNPLSQPTPEPGTFALFLSGAGALLFLRRKKLS